MKTSDLRKSFRVLVVDDHEAFRRQIREMLEENGHMVDDAASVAQAIPMVEDALYDFVLLDYRMPVHDGLWFLKNTRVPRLTKVLLMTAHSHNGIINEMFRAGARGYLIKPFEKEDLLCHLAFHARTAGAPRDAGCTFEVPH